MIQPLIALLGRKDEPTDAVEEYCRYLGDALRGHNFQLEIRRVPWEKAGWPDALHDLQAQSANWRNTCVLVQYTALAWSDRGFPQKFLRVLKILKSAGARIAVVFHDVEPYPGTRLIDSARRFAQVRTMRRALFTSDLAIFTVSPAQLSWVPRGTGAPARPELRRACAPEPQATNSPDAREPVPLKASSEQDPSQSSTAHFIPVGPNLPIPDVLPPRPAHDSVLTIGVFSITGGESGARETRVILAAVRHAAQQLGKLRLSVFGRHAEIREDDLRRGLAGLPVELFVEGVLPNTQIVRRLCACDVLLFARGGISSRRSSALAGIACGLPLIAYASSETAWPITDAGVVLVSENNQDEMNAALVRLLTDPALRADMAHRSRTAYLTHFSWPIIAARFAALLK